MYKAILFHPEGDFVTDFQNNKTKQEVWDKVNNMGSRWIFYPLPFVATDKTIVETPEGLEFLKGKRINSVKEYLKFQWSYNADKICEGINNGLPLNWIYH